MSSVCINFIFLGCFSILSKEVTKREISDKGFRVEKGFIT